MTLAGIQDNPFVYNFSQRLAGSFTAHSVYVRDYIRPKEGDKVLDIGCGTASILDLLPNVEYTGFDMNPRYINAAKKRFGSRGTFLCERVSKDAASQKLPYDIVMAYGIIHHLDDAAALELLKLASSVLKRGGRLVTADVCYADRQSGITRFLLAKDRGQFVRPKEKYAELASSVFDSIKADIRRDLLRIPSTHIIMECTSGK